MITSLCARRAHILPLFALCCTQDGITYLPDLIPTHSNTEEEKDEVPREFFLISVTSTSP